MNKIDLRTVPEIAKEVNRLIEKDIKSYEAESKRIRKKCVNREKLIKRMEASHELIEKTPKSVYSTMTAPARYEASNHIEIISSGLGGAFAASLMIAAKNNIPLVLFTEMSAQCADEATKEVMNKILQSTEYGSVNNGNMFATFFPVYQHYGDAANIIFDDDLMKELQMTDLSSSVPVRMLQMPFHHCYIQFGSVGENSVINDEYKVYNSTSGYHVLEGCMLSFHAENYIVHAGNVAEAFGFTEETDVRSFDVMFIGTPKDNMMDDACQQMTVFYDYDSDEPLTEVLRKAMDFYQHKEVYEMRPNYKNMEVRDGEQMTKNIDLLARCLVYMNCADCRKIDVDEKMPLEQQLNRIKNEKKRRRIKKQLDQASKYILIKPTVRNDALYATDTGRHVKAHWRRGHMRMQAYGEGRTKSKLIHIRPQLIGMGGLGKTPEKQTYKVK